SRRCGSKCMNPSWPKRPLRITGSEACKESTGRTLGPRQALKQRPQLISDDAINGERAARVGDLAEEEFATAVAVGVHWVNQFEARQHVQMPRVSHVGERLVQFAV